MRRFFLCTDVLVEKGEEIARGLLAAETGRRLGKEMKEGWLIMNYWVKNAQTYVKKKFVSSEKQQAERADLLRLYDF